MNINPAGNETPRFVDVHVLHCVPYSCLNRDDIGQPKQMTFGGTRRGRISSQCQKRSVRMAMQRSHALEPAIRSKRLPIDASSALEQHGWNRMAAAVATGGALASIGIEPYGEDGRRTNLVTFLPEDAADKLAGIIESRPWAKEWAEQFAPISDEEPADISEMVAKFAAALGKTAKNAADLDGGVKEKKKIIITAAEGKLLRSALPVDDAEAKAAASTIKKSRSRSDRKRQPCDLSVRADAHSVRGRRECGWICFRQPRVHGRCCVCGVRLFHCCRRFTEQTRGRSRRRHDR